MIGKSTHNLDAGTLTIEVNRALRPDLYRIAERENPKRAFLFVSTVLGRHIPVRPADHNAALDGLRDRIVPELAPGGIFVMSFAETAIGLGLGVFRALGRALPDREIAYLPTTRFPVAGREIWFETREAHSHAVDHNVMRPDAIARPDGPMATLVLVDDETTTGATFENLARGLAAAGAQFGKVVLVTLCDWSAGGAAERLGAVYPGVPVTAVSLVEGNWAWEADPTAPKARLPEPIPPACPVWVAPPVAGWSVPRLGMDHTTKHDHGARVLAMIADGRLPKLSASDRVLVIGAGEHAWQPFLAAEALSARDLDVAFTTTTRSPVRLGSVVEQQITFPDHYGLGLEMYLNNVDPDAWDHIFLFTETGHDGIPDALRSALGRAWVIDGNGAALNLNPAGRA